MADPLSSRASNPWDPQTNHSNGHPRDTPASTPPSSSPSTPTSSSSSTADTSPSTSPSPSAISIRAFLLGATLSASLLTTIHLSLPHSTPPLPLQTPATPLWRLPLFLALLSLFHYLEYHATARANPASATVSAFLLSGNGKAYNIAHGAAFLEAFLHHRVFPAYTNRLFPHSFHTAWLVLGAVMVTVGQVVRTTAMLHAGSNFNHLVQKEKRAGHVLVTRGVYRYLRHPSYFGFFWWGLGTQVVLGNVVCLVGYAVVLWRFFKRRIEKEETLLIRFFGMDYVRYRDKTRVGIPLIP